MKTLGVILIMLSAHTAHSTTIKEVFAGIKKGQEVCFGREYTTAHLKAHPQQTVKKITAKIGRTNDEFPSFPYLRLEIYQNKGPKKKLSQFLACHENNGEVMCSVDCDGGSVNILSRKKSSLLIQNNGVNLSAGCGSEDAGDLEEFIFLDNQKGGDDLFKMDLQKC